MSTQLGHDLACALDPVLFARRAGLEPDEWQADVLRSGDRRLLLNCSRQSGKSTVAAIVAVHTALYTPRSLVVLLSPSLRQSSELFRKVASVYGTIGERLPGTSETKLTLELESGSRILSLPASESTIRGFSAVSLLIVDEASRVEDDLYTAVRPMLATTGGKLLAMSTPFGKRGWWSSSWHDGGDAWRRVRITAAECPRISPEFLAEEREALGDWMYAQEYECQFVDAQSSAFRTIDIERAAADEEVMAWSL